MGIEDRAWELILGARSRRGGVRYRFDGTTAGGAEDEGSPIYGVKIPAGYRKMIAVDRLVRRMVWLTAEKGPERI
jgi:hypothetical protein